MNRHKTSIQESRRETKRTKTEDTDSRKTRKNRENKKKEKADRQRERERILRIKQEIKWKKGEGVARPGRHQRLHLRSSSYRSVAFFFPRFSFLFTLALLPACVSNSRMLGNCGRAGHWLGQ